MNKKSRKNSSLRGEKKDIHFWMPKFLYDIIKKDAKDNGRTITSQVVEKLREIYQQ